MTNKKFKKPLKRTVTTARPSSDAAVENISKGLLAFADTCAKVSSKVVLPKIG